MSNEMTIDEYLEKVNKSVQMASQIEEAKQIQKDLKAAKKELDNDLVTYSVDNMLGEIERNGKKIKAKFKRKIRIVESKSNHANRVEFLKRLIDAGYGDDVKVFQSASVEENEVMFHEDAYVDGRKWDKLMESVPSPILNKAEKDGLIWIDIIPEVTVK